MIHRLWIRFRRTFLTGLIVLMPLLITVWVLYLFTERLDRLFQPLVEAILGHPIPGLGVGIALLLILATGVIAPYYLGRRLQQGIDRLMMQLPVVRVIYGTSRKILETLQVTRAMAFQRAVLVPYPQPGSYVIGFVTAPVPPDVRRLLRETPSVRPEPGGLAWDWRSDTDWVYVFIPNTPNPTGGRTLILPQNVLIPLDLPANAALRLVMSGGLLAISEGRPETGLPETVSPKTWTPKA
ncbi:MAG: DUF502 domain-containing protein [Acidobacteria bacterium]|nr:DUF502 domain-containing protein [Acidobacteriota bacterium]MDW7983068.1 DUF502 domain-containing protein [Acidobacteriota bacterium]